MKKHLLTYLLILACTFGNVITSNGQGITVVPNPNAPDLFAWTGSGALSGYVGNPIIFNNSLVLEYNATGTSDLTQVTLQLAVYKDGDSLHVIPNPDGGQGIYFQSVQLIHNDSLFFIYLDASGVQRLASFDGTSITLYPNPDASPSGYIGSPRIFNNSLYMVYQNVSGVTQFGVFNGSGITLIPNPDNSATGFFNDYSVIFDNKICSRYVTAAGPHVLATYDGTSWTLLPNPDVSTHGVVATFPIAYNNKLYVVYWSATDQFQYMQYDGVSNPTLIANPENESANEGGVTGLQIVYNDTLFFQYENAENALQLAKFGGSSISLVPNPDATTYGFWNTPVVYNNNLYIFYLPVDGTHHLTQYQGTSNSLKVFPNPDGGLGYWDQPIVYDNNLYFQYYNASSQFQLGYFGGTSLKLISNPAGIYNGATGNNGYTGSPLIWNNLLYMQFGSVPYGSAGNLAFIDGSTLPVSLFSFTAQKNGNAALLQWKVANEVNNAYFSVEHSSNGINFLPIGKVTGHGTVSTQQAYQFTDNNPLKGLNFYRLKQVDIDGNYSYSNIETVSFSNVPSIFKVFPNPAFNSVTISVPLSAATSVIDVYDLTGKKVLEKQISANTVSESIDLGSLSAGVYQFTLLQGNQQQIVKVVKK